MSRSNARLCTTVLIILLLSNGCLGGILSDVIQSGTDIVIGNGIGIINSIPTPDMIFHASKNILIGLPVEVVSSAISQICSVALSSGTLSSRVEVDVNKMNFQLRTACNKYNYPILNSTEIWYSPEFDPNKKVIIYVSGWENTINDSRSIDMLSKAYNCRGDVNFVAVDAANFVDTLYTWSALNTEKIGASISEGLVQLIKVVPLENIHLIGHSLGAHIVGAVGRNFYYKTGKLIPRITGLDPAKPCFNEGQSLSGLMRGDAEFIDVIHSNPGVLGTRELVGDIDFYPGGLDPLPKGTFDVSSAHSRAWQYYAETIYAGNELSFMAVRCTSLTQLQQGKCPGKKFPMGYAVPIGLKGNYFLEVNGQSPYGKESDANLLKSKQSCGVCDTERSKRSNNYLLAILTNVLLENKNKT